MWTWQTAAESRALSTVAEAFNTRQGDVVVRVVPKPAVYSFLQVMTAVRGGVGPDLCVFARSVLAERAAEGMVRDLAPLMNQASPDIDMDRDFHRFAARECRLGERVVGIPLDTELRVLLFNRDALDEEGLAGSEWDPASGPVSFDRLGEVAMALNRPDASSGYARAGFVPFLGEGSPYTFLHAWRAPYFDDERCTFTADGPRVAQAARWVQSFCERADAARLVALAQRYAAVPPGSGNPFVDGSVAFLLARDRELGQIARRDPGFEIGATLVPAPGGSVESTSWATGNALTLLSETGQAQEAFRFVAYMASAEAQRAYALGAGRLPSRKDIVEDVARALGRPAFVTDAVLRGAVPSPHVPIATQFNDHVTAAWSDVILGHRDVDAGLAALQAQASAALDASGFC